MKKLFILSLILCMSLASCRNANKGGTQGSGQDSTSSQSSTPNTQSDTAKQKTDTSMHRK